MNQELNTSITQAEAKESVQAFLTEVNKTSECEHFATLICLLFDTWDFESEIERTVIDITQLMAAFTSARVSKGIADQLGDTFLADFCHFLSNLAKILLYTKNTAGCMAALDLAYLEREEEGQNYLQRIKRKYDVKLQRLKTDNS